jgi:dihydroorotase-like cyclic amidohydrolase
MKSSPPIRDLREQNLLILSLKNKYYDAVASGHFPVDPIFKIAE